MHPGGATTLASPPKPVLDGCPASAGLPEAFPLELLLEPAPVPEPLLDPEPLLEPPPPLPLSPPATGVDPPLDEPAPAGAEPPPGADVPPVAGPLLAAAPLELLEEPPGIVWMAALPDDEPPPAVGLGDWLAGSELQALQAPATSKIPTRWVWVRRFIVSLIRGSRARGLSRIRRSRARDRTCPSRRANRANVAAQTTSNKQRRATV
jgi:hypothetical protein